MEANRSRLALLGRLYEIWSWVGLVGSVGGLLLLLVDGQKSYGITLGVTGTLYWLLATAVHFVVFQGFAQGVALLLSVEELASRSVHRAGELATVVLAGQARVDAKLAQMEAALTMLLQKD